MLSSAFIVSLLSLLLSFFRYFGDYIIAGAIFTFSVTLDASTSSLLFFGSVGDWIFLEIKEEEKGRGA
jgi:hypothetical protein